MARLAINSFDRSAPWSTLQHWTKGFDHLFNDMDSVFVPFRNENNKNWPCDIYESKSEYLITFDIPGVKKEDINVEFHKNYLTISAERSMDSITKDTTQHLTERFYGTTKRNFSLPEGIDTEKISACYEDGVLSLSIPKVKEKNPKKIQINTEKIEAKN